ncbi:hypothetical protein DW195_00805 [Collinsella sp. AM17-1]|nr:hypothetical protein DW195_00805 [Collinsella sp. AM17-1]
MFNELRVLSIKIIIYKKGEIDATKRKYVICYTTRIIGNSVKAEFFTRHHYCLRDDILRLKQVLRLQQSTRWQGGRIAKNLA